MKALIATALLALGATMAKAHETTEIIVLLDRTGSMQTIKSDMEGGFAEWMRSRDKAGDETRVTLLQFDSDSMDVVYSRVAPKEATLHIEPRSLTPLYDAIAWATPIVDQIVGEHNPDHVFFVIITDGLENASIKTNSEQVRELIAARSDSMQHVYLGANQDAILVAKSLGIGGNASLTYDANSTGVSGMYMALDNAITASVTTSSDVSFTDEQRNDAVSGGGITTEGSDVCAD